MRCTGMLCCVLTLMLTALPVLGQPTGVPRELVRFAISPEGQQIVRTAETGAIPLRFASKEETRLGQ